MFIKIQELVFMRVKSIEGYVSVSEIYRKALYIKVFKLYHTVKNGVGKNNFVFDRKKP